MKNRIFLLLTVLLQAVSSFSQSPSVLESPGKKLRAEINVRKQNVAIALYTSGQKLLDVKTLQFELDKEIVQGEWILKKQTEDEVRSSWQPLYGENSRINDCYNSLALQLSSSVNNKDMIVDVRLYDEGLAFRYSFDELDFWNRVLLKENTEFVFGSDCTTWATERAQSAFYETSLRQLEGSLDRPQIVKIGSEKYVAIGEAALVDYSRMKLKKDENGIGLLSDLSGEVHLDLADYKSPWRYVMVGNNPGELVQNNYFVLNLNEPNQIECTDWIKPGDVIREVTLTTQGGLACVDFAAANGIEYVEYDAGWYGPENDEKSDATTVTVDPARSKGELDLQKVIDYANSKGVGIILYINMKALKNQLDEILPLYKKWGVKGLKYGFVDVGDQYSTSWLHHAVRKAAKYELMVDIHDEYRPTGYSRTYPNLVTQEGIRGDEESPSLQQTVYTFFSRMICGAGDYTNCMFAERVTSDKMGGRAAQLAKKVAIYSPWQFIYWYDRPYGSPVEVGGAGSSESFAKTDDITDFYCSIPTVWDETRFLEGEMGDYAVVARRSGREWFVSVLNAGGNKKLELDLSSLVAVSHYKAVLYYQSSEKSKNKISVKKYERLSDKLELDVLKNSGCVLHLKK